MRRHHHRINEEYGDYIYREERGHVSSPLIGSALVVLGLIAFIGGVIQGEFVGAFKYGGIVFGIGLLVLYLSHRARVKMDRYADRRMKHGAPIHEDY